MSQLDVFSFFHIYQTHGENETNSSQYDVQEDYSDTVHWILLKFLRPPVLIFGIIGNILNLIILFKHKSRRTRSTIAFLSALSIMDLFLLIIQSIFIVLELLRTMFPMFKSFLSYYRCYIRYEEFSNRSFNHNCAILSFFLLKNK